MRTLPYPPAIQPVARSQRNLPAIFAQARNRTASRTSTIHFHMNGGKNQGEDRRPVAQNQKLIGCLHFLTIGRWVDQTLSLSLHSLYSRRAVGALPQPILRPMTTPSHTATKPRTTLRITFKNAKRTSPSWNDRSVSSSNVENVVYAPMKPMGIM